MAGTQHVRSFSQGSARESRRNRRAAAGITLAQATTKSPERVLMSTVMTDSAPFGVRISSMSCAGEATEYSSHGFVAVGSGTNNSVSALAAIQASQPKLTGTPEIFIVKCSPQTANPTHVNIQEKMVDGSEKIGALTLTSQELYHGPRDPGLTDFIISTGGAPDAPTVAFKLFVAWRRSSTDEAS